MYSVYWISHKDHTDIFSQGYVGVSNNPKKRWDGHKLKPQKGHFANAINKYGWGNLVKKVVLIGEENYCLEIEQKLRPTEQIGWNLVAGGGKPPSALGKKFGPMSDEVKAKVSAAKKGFKHTPEIEAKVTQNLIIHGNATRFQKGLVPWNKGKPALPHVIEAVKKANIGRVQSEEEKAKRAESLKGHRVSEYTKERMRQLGLVSSKVNMGRKHEKIKCPHCNKIGGSTAMPRWHFDNCKFKENQ
jgi:hypothetical protein